MYVSTNEWSACQGLLSLSACIIASELTISLAYPLDINAVKRLLFIFMNDTSYKSGCSQAAALLHFLTPCCMMQLIEGAEVKALYGPTLNYKPLLCDAADRGCRSESTVWADPELQSCCVLQLIEGAEVKALCGLLLLLTCCCVLQLIEGAEVKALYGLTLNYKPLEALVERLLRDTTLSGEQVADLLNDAGVIPFPDPFVEGFKWDDNGRLVYPGMPDEVCITAGASCE